MKTLFTFFMVISFALVGCSQESKNGLSEPITENDSETHTEIETESNNISEKGEHQPLLFVNGKEFEAIATNEMEFVVGEFIGTVKEKIELGKRPNIELTSNYLREGIEIYSVEGNPEVVLAKNENGNYEVFKLFLFN